MFYSIQCHVGKQVTSSKSFFQTDEEDSYKGSVPAQAAELSWNLPSQDLG